MAIKINDQDAIRTDAVEFARQILHQEPHTGQIELLRGIKKRTVIRAGRQWGKSTVLAWYILWYICTHRDRVVLIVAPTVDQSKIIFREITQHLRSGPLAKLLRKDPTESPFPSILLKNGCEVHGRGSSSPEFVRGKKVHLIIADETSFIKDDVIKFVLLPMLIVTGQIKDSAIILISTPFGQGEFQDQYKLADRKMSEGNPGYAAYHYTSLDNPHADKEFLQEIMEENGEESLLWQTEYLAEFADSDLSVFRTADILAACDAWNYESFPVAPRDRHRYVQGVDLANLRDYFVASVLDTTDPSMCPLVSLDRHQRKGYAYYKNIIRDNYKRYNGCSTMIDATSLGSTVSDDLADIRAEGYPIGSNSAKWDLVQELVRMFQEKRISIPRDPEMLKELRYFAYEVTKAKVVRMEAKKGHDDIVMSLAFSARLANRPQYTGFFRGVDLSRPARVSRSTLRLMRDTDDDEEILATYIRKINNGEPT